MVPPPLRWLLAACLGAAIFAATAELAVRVLRPPPRVQVVRPSSEPGDGGARMSLVGGQPIWTSPGSRPRQRPACDEGAREVMLLGSSILFGDGLEAPEAVSARLQDLLGAEGDPWCVRNHAQPGFVGAQQLVLARALVPELRPAVIVWEVWLSNPAGYTLIGGSAYNLGGLRVDDAGYPAAALPVPSSVHHLLFRRSRAWEYLTLTTGGRDLAQAFSVWERYPDEQLRVLREVAAQHDAQVLLVLMPWLDRPFATTVEEQRGPMHPYGEVVRWAEAQGVAVVDVADALRAHDPADLRLDLVHFSARGHELLAEVLAPWVRRLGAGQPADAEAHNAEAHR